MFLPLEIFQLSSYSFMIVPYDEIKQFPVCCSTWCHAYTSHIKDLLDEVRDSGTTIFVLIFTGITRYSLLVLEVELCCFLLYLERNYR